MAYHKGKKILFRYIASQYALADGSPLGLAMSARSLGGGVGGFLMFIYDYMTAIQEFKEKQDILSERLFPVSPLDFYKDIFPDDEIERKGHSEDEQPNPIFAFSVEGDEVGRNGKKKTFFRNEIMFSDRAVLDKVIGNDFAICSLCTYSGRTRTAKNAYRCYGFAIDLDDVGPKELEIVLLGVDIEKLPRPTYIVNSGHGLHLYYIFQSPVPLYPNVVNRLQLLKHGLTWAVWTNETSRIKSTPSKDNRQYQGIYQGFRCPGSLTKLGQGKGRKKYVVSAYSFGNPQRDRTTFWELNKWVQEKYRVPDNPDYSSWEWADDHITLAEAKERWPQWYEKMKLGITDKCHSPRGLYDWWFKKIQDENNVRDGNRYNCIAGLFICAIKSDVPREEVWKDAVSLLDWLDSLTISGNNQFTIEDIKAAAKYYKKSYARYSRKALEARTGIKIPPREPPARTQVEHLKRTRAIRQVLGSYERVGRPRSEEQVKQWRAEHPNGRKTDCIKETGLSKPTVLKWWGE